MAEDKEINFEEELKEEKKEFKKRYIGIGLAILAVIGGGFWAWDASLYQSTDDAYVESHMVKIAPRVSGQIEEIFITDNQAVKEGDVVAIIDARDYQVRFDQADAQYQKALFAQDVAKALDEVGVNQNDFGLVSHDYWADEETGEEKDCYGLAYTEFIALNTYMIQKQQAKIEEQQTQIASLEERIAALEELVNAN